jgi:hypothetical protein
MGGHNGVKSDLLANSGALANEGNSALGLEPGLASTYSALATHPAGYDPATLGQMTTAAEQSAGGGASGATGEAQLRANRTRNIGSGQAASAYGNAEASKDLSQRNAEIQTGNAALKQRQQSEGLAGESGLVSGGENALGLSDTALKDAGDLPNFWQNLMLQGVKSGGEDAAAYLGTR